MKRRCPFCGKSHGKKNAAQRAGAKVAKVPCTRCVDAARDNPQARYYLWQRFGIRA